MTEGILIAFITGGLAIVSNVVVAWAQNSKTLYRIDQLEKKVEKHNNLVERMAIEEQTNKAQWRKIDEMSEQLEDMRK
jgi:hypothetical protein